MQLAILGKKLRKDPRVCCPQADRMLSPVQFGSCSTSIVLPNTLMSTAVTSLVISIVVRLAHRQFPSFSEPGAQPLAIAQTVGERC